LFSPAVLNHIPDGKCDIEKTLFPALMAAGLPLYAYSTPEYLKDMGTPDRLARVEQDFQSGRIQAMSLAHPRRAVFLDRDGVLNRYVPDLNQAEQFELIPGAAEAVRALNHAGWLVIVVTNQPAVAKGFLSETELDRIHRRLETELGQAGAILDAIYVCPHHPERGFAGEVPELKRVCDCRKPATGMLEQARERFHLELSACWLIGDSVRDYLTACHAGLPFLGVQTGLACADARQPEEIPPRLCADLPAAVHTLLATSLTTDCPDSTPHRPAD
jgi:histidinol-phosphate phosphatase family protein